MFQCSSQLNHQWILFLADVRNKSCRDPPIKCLHWMLPKLLISIDFVNSSGVTKLLTAVYFRWILKRYSIVLQRLVFLILQQCSRCKDNKKIWHISQTKCWLFIDFVIKILMCSECYSVVFLCQ